MFHQCSTEYEIPIISVFDFYLSRKISQVRVPGFIWSQIHLENTLPKEIALHRVQDGSKSKCHQSVTRTVTASNFWAPPKGENLFERTACGLDKIGADSSIWWLLGSLKRVFCTSEWLLRYQQLMDCFMWNITFMVFEIMELGEACKH